MKFIILAIVTAIYATIAVAAASAQDSKSVHVGSTYLDVEVKQGFTDVCTRVDAHTLTCTRFEAGKATDTFTVKL